FLRTGDDLSSCFVLGLVDLAAREMLLQGTGGFPEGSSTKTPGGVPTLHTSTSRTKAILGRFGHGEPKTRCRLNTSFGQRLSTPKPSTPCWLHTIVFAEPLPWPMETIAPIGQLRRKLLSRCGSGDAIPNRCVGRS